RCFVVNVGAPEAAKVEVKATDKKDDKAPAAAAASHANRDGLYIGKDGGPGARTGLKCFEEVDEIAIVAAPGQTSPAVQDALLSHCETRKDRFAILDSPEVINGGVDRLPRPRDSKYGAYYFPWIQVYDPEKGNIYVPPSGHVAGIYSRVDSERGVHKAPANEIVRGAPEGAAKPEVKPAGDKKDDKAPAVVVAPGGGRDALYIGKDAGPGARTGLKCFDEIDEIAIIAAPGQTSPAVQDALLSHAETRKDRFAILDSPETITGGIDKLPKPRDSKYGAYYFPWIQVYDPDKGNIFV
ncbi:MAG: phage tail sheath subtilisin-like domain-containing protein, partial [Haliangium ochraceum]